MDEYRLWLATKDLPFIQILKFRVQVKCAHWRGRPLEAEALSVFTSCFRAIAHQAAAAAHTPLPTRW